MARTDEIEQANGVRMLLCSISPVSVYLSIYSIQLLLVTQRKGTAWCGTHGRMVHLQRAHIIHVYFQSTQAK
jgi:hypothetical protein